MTAAAAPHTAGASHHDCSDAAASFTIERAEGGVRLSGTFRTKDAARAWDELHAAVAGAGPGELALDLSGVERIDGGVIALIVAARDELAALGVNARIVSTPEHVRPLFELYRGLEAASVRAQRPALGHIETIGDVAVRWAAAMRVAVLFLAEVGAAFVSLLRRPRSAHLKEVPSFVQHAGFDALPIVSLISFLVGFVMGYQSARQLERFGANVYVADLVGISITRELAPLMTAIIVAGRSGAAFAAEISTMKVSDEVDALRVMGLRPIAWLVVPRLIALVIVLPILVLVSDVIGIIGGLVVAVMSLDVSARAYLLETRRGLVPWDVGQGLIKSVPFGLTIALIACQQGFAASGGAESVGRRTTTTVVTCLFALVFLDAAFTFTFRLMGL